MKKTQRKDAFRNIRKRIVSYLSICLVIMLGLGGVFTTRYMDAGLVKQASDYYDQLSKVIEKQTESMSDLKRLL